MPTDSPIACGVRAADTRKRNAAVRESRRADIAQSLKKSALIVGEVGIAAGGGL